MMLFPIAASAGKLQLNNTFSIGGETNNNVTLTESEKENDQLSNMFWRVNVKYEDQLNSLSSSAYAARKNYADNDNLDSSNYAVGLDWQRGSQRSTIAVSAERSRFESTTLQFDEAQLVEGVTFGVNEIEYRTTDDLSASYQYQISPLFGTTLFLAGSDVMFEGEQQTLNSPYLNYGGGMRLTYSMSSLAQIYFSQNVFRYKPDDDSLVSDSYATNLGAQYRFSPTLFSSLEVGNRHSVITLQGADDERRETDNGLNVAFAFDWDNLHWQSGVQFSREFSPNSSGNLATQDKISANYSYQFDKGFRTRLASYWVKDAPRNTEFSDKEYYRFLFAIDKELDRAFKVSTFYGFQLHDRQSEHVSRSVFGVSLEFRTKYIRSNF